MFDLPNRFFFVIGMPRCRTAWLSVFLTGRDSFCFHEGEGRFEDWPAYVAALRARPESYVGDSSPALCAHIDEVLAEFPSARFLVVRRDPAEALEAFCAAAPDDAATIRAGWAGYMEKFEAAVAKIPEALNLRLPHMESEATFAVIHAHLLHSAMDVERFRKLRDLHITSTFPAVLRKEPPKPLSVSVSVDGFDFSGLTVRLYLSSDKEMVSDWWSKHRDGKFNSVLLPPLGIIVEDECGPAAALWCFETYGTGVAWIEHPITRPGMSYFRASTVLAFAVMVITKLAGRSYEPPASFTRFRVCCPPPMARTLKRLGFRESAQRSNLLLSI